MFRDAAVTVSARAIILDLRACGAPADAHVSTDVAFDDLNLLQAEDVKILGDRLRAEARKIIVEGDKAKLPCGKIDQEAIDEGIELAIGTAIKNFKGRLEDKILASLIDARQQQARCNSLTAWAESQQTRSRDRRPSFSRRAHKSFTQTAGAWQGQRTVL